MTALIGFVTGGWMRWAVLAAIVCALFYAGCEHLINVGRSQVLSENRVAAAKIMFQPGRVYSSGRILSGQYLQDGA